VLKAGWSNNKKLDGESDYSESFVEQRSMADVVVALRSSEEEEKISCFHFQT